MRDGTPVSVMELCAVRDRRRWLLLQRAPATGQQALVTDLPNTRGTRVVLLEFPLEESAFERLSHARRMVDELVKTHADDIALSCHGGDAARSELLIEALLSALLAQAARLPSYKADAGDSATVRRIRVFGSRRADSFARCRAEAAGNALARHLAVLPPNELAPAQYRVRAEALAREHGWDCEFLDQTALA